MTATNWRNSALGLLVLASVTACQAADLSGTTWTVTRLAGAELTDRPPTLEIEGNAVSGFAGCNRYAGKVEIKGDSLRFSRLIATRMACLGPGMAVEDAFLKALETRVAAVHLKGEAAELVDAAGQPVIELSRTR